METTQHRKARAVCAMCGRLLDQFPIFHCPQKHPCCHGCFRELSSRAKGNVSYMPCQLCRVAAKPFEDSCLNSNQFHQTITKPGIGRPCRYKVNPLPITTYSYSKNYQDFYAPSMTATNIEDEEKMFESLIGMSKKKFYMSQALYNENGNEAKKTRPYSPKSKFSLPPATSKRPFRCPHKPCYKTVALAQIISHFKSEHKEVKICSTERGKELLLPCDISLIEYNFHFCLAMITVYEINRIDYLKSGSSESIVRTCNKFCQKVPISTFWLMVSGSSEQKMNDAYCLFWLFTNSEESHKCTIELGSQDDSVSLSAYCGVSKALDNDFANVKNKLRCLVVTKASLKAILKEGAALNLRVIVH